MTGKPNPTGKQLDAIFQVVVNEAHANTKFAAKLRAALHAPQAQPASPIENKNTTQPEATPEIHAVNILRQHGEQMLRGRLSQLRTKAALGAVAKRSGLRLTGKSIQKSATRPDLIEGIIDAAKQYDSQRGAAEG